MRSTHIAVVLVVLALPSSGRAYSVKRTSSGATLHWRADVVELALHSSMVDRFGEVGARRALAEAIAAWSRAEHGPRLAVDRDTWAPPGFDRAGDKVNGVYAVSPWPYEPKLLAVTISSYDTRTGELLDADVLVNADEALDAERRDGHYDLAAILTHELGHVLGLGESEDDPDSSMYPRIGRSDTRARTPTTDDLDGLLAIYAPPRSESRLGHALSRHRGAFAGLCFFASGIVLFTGRVRSRGLPLRYAARVAHGAASPREA